ncbi:hypothetical protein ACFX2A_017382 [Malus domestica]
MFIHNLQSHWFTQDKYTMISSTSPFFISLIILLLIANTSTQSLDRQQPFLRVACSYNKGNYTNNSVYQTNLNRLLPSLLLSNVNSNGYGFYSYSNGENSDQVNAIGLCRGDLIADACSACLGNSTNILTQTCPNQMEATIWNENCMLRYSNRTLYGILEVLPAFYQSNSENVSSSSSVVDEFNQHLMTLLESLRSEVSGGGSLRKYAVGNKSVTDSNRTMFVLFGLAQCTPDLSTLDCNHCLNSGLEVINNNFYGKDSVRFVKPSCNLRYEAYLFFDPAIGSSGSLAPAPTSPPSGKKSTHTPWVIIIPFVATAEVSVLVISMCMCLRAKKRKNRLTEEEITNADQITSAEALQFDFDSIRVATNNFSEANKLGRGGLGTVYKGKLASDEDIAVKRLSRDSAQGDLEFKNEVSLVARLQHRNLVRLLGFCLEGNERLLVYEFVPNGSLDQFIFDPVKRADLNLQNYSRHWTRTSLPSRRFSSQDYSP